MMCNLPFHCIPALGCLLQRDLVPGMVREGFGAAALQGGAGIGHNITNTAAKPFQRVHLFAVLVTAVYAAMRHDRALSLVLDNTPSEDRGCPGDRPR